MHKHYFPLCTVQGLIEPAVPFSHIGCSGAVPAKCVSCSNLFEGECRRVPGEYRHLDHGPCPVSGPTDPVHFENNFVVSKVEIPRKCARCHFLKNDSDWGFYCGFEAEKWGFYVRGLDWGYWTPETIYLELPAPKLTTKVLAHCATQNDLVGFVREHRRINPGLSLREARADFDYLQGILKS